MHVGFDKGSLHEYTDYNETAEVIDFGDGTYSILFNATVAGYYEVAVLVLEQNIAGSPARPHLHFVKYEMTPAGKS